jgi:hypothetical protein
MFDHGQKLAQRTAKEQLEFIKANIEYLRLADKKGKMEKQIPSFHQTLKDYGKLFPDQLSEIGHIYEAVMKGYGLPSCEKLHKPRWSELKH